MKLTFALRDKKNALKLSTKTLERFIERIKTDTKDGAVARRRKQLSYGDYLDGDDRQNPSHLIYPSAEFKKDDNDNLRMKTFNGVVALTVDKLESQEDIDAVKRAAQILHYTLAAFVGHKGSEVIILVRIEKSEGTYQSISGPYSEISGPYSDSDNHSAEQERNSAGRKNISAGRKNFFSEQKNISVGQNESYPTEEETDVLTDPSGSLSRQENVEKIAFSAICCHESPYCHNKQLTLIQHVTLRSGSMAANIQKLKNNSRTHKAAFHESFRQSLSLIQIVPFTHSDNLHTL